MCRGEMVARIWHALRCDPNGFPALALRIKAKQNDHDPAELLQRVLHGGKAQIEMRNGTRWLVPGPRFNPGLED